MILQEREMNRRLSGYNQIIKSDALLDLTELSCKISFDNLAPLVILNFQIPSSVRSALDM